MVRIIMIPRLLLTVVIKVSNHLALGEVGDGEASSGKSWGEFRS